MSTQVSSRSPARLALVICGWVAAIAFVIVPVVTDESWAWALFGLALGVRLVEDTIPVSARTRWALLAVYVAVGVAGLVVLLGS